MDVTLKANVEKAGVITPRRRPDREMWQSRYLYLLLLTGVLL